MIAKKVIIQYKNLPRKNKVIENAVIFSDGGILHVKGRKLNECIVLHDIHFESISREYISFMCLEQRNDNAYNCVVIHVIQQPSFE
jgi:hypothetical protein